MAEFVDATRVGISVCGRAQPAPPGEFSKRAFCNGKLALSRAEAVITLIDAENDAQLRVAGGAGSRKTHARIGRAIQPTALWRSVVCMRILTIPTKIWRTCQYNSFPNFWNRCSHRSNSCCKVIAADAILQGVRCAIVGKPNTGKSSLLNCLAQESCAIVTDIAGKTRDVVRETVSVGQVTPDWQTRQAFENVRYGRTDGRDARNGGIEQAELVLAVFDGSREADDEDAEVLSACTSRLPGYLCGQ